MTKTQLIEKIAKENEIPKKQVEQVVNAFLSSMEDSLIAGESIQISGFGTFSVKEKAAYTGRNPRTNEPVQILASKKVGFSTGKTLKDKINET